jgi:hypothetical protein
MSNLINPNDLGDFNFPIHNRQCVRISELVRQASKEWKKTFVKSELSVLGVNINLTTSKTRFGGERLWFACPLCNRRAGSLYVDSSGHGVGCRACLVEAL